MKSSFKIRTDTYYVHEVDTKLFSGGEINVTIPPLKLNFYRHIFVEATIMDAEGLMTLAMIKDAIGRDVAEAADIHLRLGYVPYARQDRVCNRGEALSIKVFCSMINNMNFKSVTILDPHSDVTPALLDRCQVIEPTSVLDRYEGLTGDLLRGEVTLVAPDAGSTKKVEKVSQHYGGIEIIQGMKKRDVKTGKLSGFEYYGDVDGKDLLIVDDIIDGGFTFIGLTRKLKEGGAKTVSLYASHGIFSKGIDVLLEGGIDNIYTTDSCNSGIEHGKLEVIPWI